MLRSFILAGLMTATAVGSVAPAYAQWRVDNRSQQRPDQAQGDGGARQEGRRQWQDNRQAQPQPQPRPQAQAQVQPRPQPQPQPRNEGDMRRGGGGPVMSQERREGQWQQRADRPADQDRRQAQPAAANDDRYRRGNGGDGRQDWRNDNRRGDQRDWRNDPRADNRRSDDNRRWNDRRDYDGRGTAWTKDNRRFDDRTRWADQRRWNNNWRQDRRYDWSSYRARYGDRFRVGRYYAPRGWSYGYRPVTVGFFLSSLLYSNNYWLDDPYSYRLPPAYGAMRWVRYYDDALLVDTRDGYVVDVIRDFFW